MDTVEQLASPPAPRPSRYRLLLEGELNGTWADWFGEAELSAGSGRTALEIEVIDQAQLHAVLRRVHDLHLRLVSVTRIDPEGTPTTGGIP